METNDYFAYLRESVDLDTGIKIQREKIEKYCNYKNIKISKWFVDNDQSAYKLRPNYDKMLKGLLTSTEAKGLICTHLSRFGRSTAEVLIDHQKIKTAGKELILTENNIDSTTITGKAMLGMLAVFNDFERDTVVERLLSGRIYAAIHGTKSGKPLHRPKAPIDWKKVIEYRILGLSIPSIAKLVGVSKKTMYDRVKKEGANNGWNTG